MTVLSVDVWLERPGMVHEAGTTPGGPTTLRGDHSAGTHKHHHLTCAKTFFKAKLKFKIAFSPPIFTPRPPRRTFSRVVFIQSSF